MISLFYIFISLFIVISFSLPLVRFLTTRIPSKERHRIRNEVYEKYEDITISESKNFANSATRCLIKKCEFCNSEEPLYSYPVKFLQNSYVPIFILLYIFTVGLYLLYVIYFNLLLKIGGGIKLYYCFNPDCPEIIYMDW